MKKASELGRRTKQGLAIHNIKSVSRKSILCYVYNNCTDFFHLSQQVTARLFQFTFVLRKYP